MRNKFIALALLVMFIVFVISGCASSPSLAVSRPQPPEYMAVPDSVPVPVAVVQHTIFMLDYIGRLEVYADSLEAVIDDLC